jgi:hypothetical protein
VGEDGGAMEKELAGPKVVEGAAKNSCAFVAEGAAQSEGAHQGSAVAGLGKGAGGVGELARSGRGVCASGVEEQGGSPSGNAPPTRETRVADAELAVGVAPAALSAETSLGEGANAKEGVLPTAGTAVDIHRGAGASTAALSATATRSQQEGLRELVQDTAANPGVSAAGLSGTRSQADVAMEEPRETAQSKVADTSVPAAGQGGAQLATDVPMEEPDAITRSEATNADTPAAEPAGVQHGTDVPVTESLETAHSKVTSFDAPDASAGNPAKTKPGADLLVTESLEMAQGKVASVDAPGASAENPAKTQQGGEEQAEEPRGTTQGEVATVFPPVAESATIQYGVDTPTEEARELSQREIANMDASAENPARTQRGVDLPSEVSCETAQTEAPEGDVPIEELAVTQQGPIASMPGTLPHSVAGRSATNSGMAVHSKGKSTEAPNKVSVGSLDSEARGHGISSEEPPVSLQVEDARHGGDSATSLSCDCMAGTGRSEGSSSSTASESRAESRAPEGEASHHDGGTGRAEQNATQETPSVRPERVVIHATADAFPYSVKKHAEAMARSPPQKLPLCSRSRFL